MNTVTAEPYKVTKEEVGILQTERINVIHMPRERFMELVDKTLADTREADTPDAVIDELRNTARVMPRFPLGLWWNPTRGCGCVIGEYLIAREEIERSSVAALTGALDAHHTVERLLEDNPNGSFLIVFGQEIDSAVKQHISKAGIVVNSGALVSNVSSNVRGFVKSVVIDD